MLLDICNLIVVLYAKDKVLIRENFTLKHKTFQTTSYLGEGRHKKGIFNSQVDYRGCGAGGVTPPSQTVGICKKEITPFSLTIWFFCSQNEFYLIVK